MKRETQTQIVNDMRLLMGFNADGSRTGNGLLGDTKILKQDVESINRNIISIDSKLEKSCEDIKQIKESLNDKIGMSSISSIHKILICVGALFGVISFIISISSKLSL